jgi:hypothetical protein
MKEKYLSQAGWDSKRLLNEMSYSEEIKNLDVYIYEQ